MRDPSWRAALLGAARDPVQAAAVVAATALLVLTSATGSLVEWTSGQAATERLVDAAIARDPTGAAVDLVARVPPDEPAITEQVDERLDAVDGFDPALLQVTSLGWQVRSGGDAVRPVVRANGRVAVAVLHHREGAIESLEVVAGPDPGGDLWVPADLAEQLDVGPGDTVEVGFDPVGAAAVRSGTDAVVAGTYATTDGRPAGELAGEEVRLPPAPGDRSEPAPLLLGDVATVQSLGTALGDLQVTTLRAPITQPPQYEALRRGVEQLEALERDLFDAESPLGAAIFERFAGPEVRVSTDVRRLTTQAVTTADAVAAQTAGAATAGILLAAITLVTAVAAGARRRRAGTELELVQGAAPVGIAVRAVLEVAPWVLVGAVVGRVVVLPAARLVLPAARVPDPAVAALTPRAAAVVGVALLLVLGVRVADARLRLVALGGRDTSRSVPAVPVLLAAAAVVTLGVVLGPPRPPTDPLVMLLPVLVIAAVAVVVLRLLVAAVPRRSGVPAGEPTAGWLARRRLTGQSDRLVAIGAIVAVAAGLVAHTSVLRTSGQVAVDAKAAAFAGASVVVEVPGPSVTDGRDLPTGTSLVLTDARVRIAPEDVAATLLAVDPATFSTVATWPTGTSPTVLDDLEGADGTSLPVLAVGGATALGERGTLERDPFWTVPFEIVGRPAALPGSVPGRPVLLTTQTALFDRLGPALDPRPAPLDPGSSDPDGPWTTQVWVDVDEPGLLAALSAAAVDDGGGVSVVRTLAEVRNQPAYLATQWGLGVLGGLGVLVLVLALLLLGGTRARGAEEAGLEHVVLERLGIAGHVQRRAAVLERLLLVAVAGAVGIGAGTALAAVVAGAADPAPDVVPALRPVLPVALLAGLAAALLAGGLVAGLLDDRAARRADVEEALRVAR